MGLAETGRDGRNQGSQELSDEAGCRNGCGLH